MATRVTSVKESNEQARSQILAYLYDRNKNATSARGKRGAAVKIGDMRRELKAKHGLSCECVISNLRYLISQKWVDEDEVSRVVPINGGIQIPSTTPFYAISAAGIDKIEGPSDFTPRDRFAGIQINASDQSTVTVGDGNQVNVKYEEEGESLAQLCEAIKQTAELDVHQKMDAVADIDTIQSQLARSTPNPTIIGAAWAAIEPLCKIASLVKIILSVGQKLLPFLPEG